MFATILLFAEGENQGGGSIFASPLIPLFIIVAFFLIMSIRKSSVQNRERQAMLANLEKNDKVLTIGGIYGTVVMVDPTDDEVTIKVDDNARLKITKGSISRNITKEKTGAVPKTDAAAPASSTAVTTKPNG